MMNTKPMRRAGRLSPRSLMLIAAALLTGAFSGGRWARRAAPPVVTAAAPIVIIPTPKRLTLRDGGIDLGTPAGPRLALIAGPAGREAARAFQEDLRLGFGMAAPIAAEAGGQSVQVHFDLSREGTGGQALPPEYYAVAADGNSVRVSGKDSAGLYWGARTLCQLLHTRNGHVLLRRVEIQDWPTLRWRGAHLFCGRHALPFHERLIANVFTRFKLNNLVLQCEQAKWDTLGKAVPDWAMSKADLREDIAFARAHHMEVTPLVNSVGHMPWLLSQRAYRDLAEDPKTPFAIRPDSPKTYGFLFPLYDEVDNTFHSPIFHIGGDEVTLRGRYPYSSASRYSSVTDAYAAHVNKLQRHLKARGRRMAIWTDMMLAPGDAPDAANAVSAAEAVRLRSLLPKDLILFDWHYARADKYATPRLFQDAGFPTVVGAAWDSPRNIQRFSRSLADQHAAGLLQTTWCGYESKEENLKSARPQFVAFVLAAEESWNGGSVDVEHLPYDPGKVFDDAYRLPVK